MHKKEIFVGLMTALVLALLISPFASPWPDGLERVAKDQGFLEKGEGPPVLAAPVPDYSFPGICNKKWATSIAGLLGTLAMFGIGCGVAALLKRRKE
jgi:cobalt/nickel transport protein